MFLVPCNTVLDNAYIAGFAKIFGTYDKDIIKQCQFYCGATPLCGIIDLRRLNFLNGIRKNGSNAISLLFEVDVKVEFSVFLLSTHCPKSVSVIIGKILYGPTLLIH